nr:putative ribonuclease H-like domain-containing protein [Tanacetum cinerariifolium]
MVEKAFYGLHQAPRAWYETLSTFLLQNGYRRRTIDNTLFIKKDKDDIMLVQVYVDDIIFGSTKKSLCDEFKALMHTRFQMSSMGELTFFLGIQVPGYTKAFTSSCCEADISVSLRRLISWQCKKQTIVATFTTEAEYVTAANCLDFLTSSSIHHSLAVSPTIYASNIKQFWNSATSQTINDEKQIHAIVDGDPLFLIQRWMLRLSIRKGDSLERAATTASLDAQQDSSNITKTQSKVTLNEPTPQGEGSGSGHGRQETIGGYTVGSGEDRMEHDIEFTNLIPQTPYDLPLSGGHTPGSDEGSMTLKELTDLCTTLLQKFFDLENDKTAQANEIASLKKRTTKLEQRHSLRFLGFHSFRAGASKRNSLGRRKVSKGRKNLKAGASKRNSLGRRKVSKGRKNLKLKLMFQDNVIDKDTDTEMIVEDKGNGEKRDVTIPDTLVKIKNQKSKERGIAFKDTDDSARLNKTITTLQPFPTIDPKDKGGHTPGSDEGSMTLKELTNLCTTLLQKFFDLENDKTAQANEIASLKKRTTKLEQRHSLRFLGFHPFRAGASKRNSLGRRK